MEYKIEKISHQNYAKWLTIVNQSRWGNILLPNEFGANLWGGVVYEDTELIGGWVGILRGDKPLIKWMAKSVYFDSYPLFLSQQACDKYQEELIKDVQTWARREHIVMFNLTHWVRGRNAPYLNKEINATLLLPLQDSIEKQWKLVESKQRNKIRKGEKNNVKMSVLSGEEALSELAVLQLLRAKTQDHAIQKNSNSSMLLKSDSFFENILLHTNSRLFIGSVNGQPATAAVMIVSGETAYYYSGGSDYELNRQTGCSAYVIWKTIEYFLEQPRIKYMDMGGVPPTPKPTDPAYGVYMFKRSFGGEYMEFDSGVIVIHKLKYTILKQVLSWRSVLRLFSKYL